MTVRKINSRIFNMKAKCFCFLFASLTISLAVSAQGDASWLQFRGPNCAGVSEGGKPPIYFGTKSNVLWKTEIPGGVSSPCVVRERVFVTAFEEGKLVTIGVDARTGKVLWKQAAPATKIESTHKVGSPASATPAADGERIYSYFGSYGVVAYDLDGREQWRKPLDIGLVINGSGTSPVLIKNRLIINGDQQDGKSFVIALDPKSGKTLWQTPRPDFVSSYTTPVLWSHDGEDDVVVVGSVRVVGYGLQDGKERWTVRGTEGVSVAPTPVAGDGQLIVMSRAFAGAKIPTFPEFLAQNDKDTDGKISRDEAPGYLREHGGFMAADRDKDGRISEPEWSGMRNLITRGEHGIFAVRAPSKNENGDLTDTHVMWKEKKGATAVASPLLFRGRVYVVQDGGRVSCYEAKSGKVLFEQERLEVDGSYFASPIAANGSIYFGSSKGVVTVVEPADTLKVKARNDIGEAIFATSAITGNTLYVRSANHLWAFGER
jgi:outer membrane protein assembly factor BamB